MNCNKWPFGPGVVAYPGAPGATIEVLMFQADYDELGCPALSYTHVASVPAGWAFLGTSPINVLTGVVGPFAPGQPPPFTLNPHEMAAYYARVQISAGAVVGTTVRAPHIDEVRSGQTSSAEGYVRIL